MANPKTNTDNNEDSVSLTDITVFDVEVHTHISYSQLVSYINDDDLRENEISGYPSNKGPIPTDGWDRSAGGRIDREVKSVEYANDYGEPAEDFGIDKTIFSPGTGFRICQIPDADKRIAYLRANNNLILDRLAKPEQDYFAKVNILPEHPKISVEEINRVGSEDGIVAAFCADHGMSYPLGHKRYEPIYEALEKHDLPLFMHGDSAILPWFPTGGFNFDKYLEIHTLSHPLAKMWHATSIVTQGIPERYDVDFCFLEAGQSWVQFLRSRIDREYTERPNDAPSLSKLPSKYIDQFYIGTQPWEKHRNPMDWKHLLKMTNLEDQLVFATDYPHSDFDTPDKIAKNDVLTTDQKVKILQTNPKELLGL